MISATQLNFLTHGSAEALPVRIPLRAGPLTLVFEAGDLRYLRVGNREVIRRIYAAVRDENWATIPAVISNLKCEAEADSFRISYTCTHRERGIHFVWQAQIRGEADGTIHFEFDGIAKSTFLRNRIGFCVLHPIRECAGAKVRALYMDGTEKELRFPDIIAPEQPVNGFSNLRGLAHEISTDCWAELTFAGDAFDTEDQRNWIDASFKTFCTPISLPFPVEIKSGTKVKQAVTLRLSSDVAYTTLTAEHSKVVTLQVDRAVKHPLPALGLGMASHGRPLSESEVSRLVVLGLIHLRCDLRLADPDWRAKLRSSARDAVELGVALELAIHLPADGGGDFVAVRKELTGLRVDLTRAMVFRDGQKSTLPDDLAAAIAELLDCGMPIGAGTNADLYQLNLQRPPAEADFIAWSMNPQVHAFDIASLAETPEAVVQQVTSVREYFPGSPAVVSPITFKPRFNPVATGSAAATAPNAQPSQVDARQLSLFGAGWTLAMIKALAQGGAESCTFFETTGWLGVMESEAGSPLPETFPSIPGAVFPLYHVLADVAEFAGGEVLQIETSAPLAVVACALTLGSRTALLLANLSGEARQVELANFPECTRLRRLDAGNVKLAMTEPEAYRTVWLTHASRVIELPPFGLATLVGGSRVAKGNL